MLDSDFYQSLNFQSNVIACLLLKLNGFITNSNCSKNLQFQIRFLNYNEHKNQVIQMLIAKIATDNSVNDLIKYFGQLMQNKLFATCFVLLLILGVLRWLYGLFMFWVVRPHDPDAYHEYKEDRRAEEISDAIDRQTRMQNSNDFFDRNTWHNHF